MFFVIGLGVTDGREILISTKHATTEPHSISLDHVLVHANFDWLGLSARYFCVGIHPVIDAFLDKAGQFFIEAVE